LPGKPNAVDEPRGKDALRSTPMTTISVGHYGRDKHRDLVRDRRYLPEEEFSVYLLSSAERVIEKRPQRVLWTVYSTKHNPGQQLELPLSSSRDKNIDYLSRPIPHLNLYKSTAILSEIGSGC
jgi:hypothetical protein